MYLWVMVFVDVVVCMGEDGGIVLMWFGWLLLWLLVEWMCL